jgi:phosphatidylinositol-3-phosphatase
MSRWRLLGSGRRLTGGGDQRPVFQFPRVACSDRRIATRNTRGHAPHTFGGRTITQRKRRRWFRLAAVALMAGGMGVIGLSVSAYGASSAAASHIMVVMMENEGQGELIGNPAAPNTNALATHYGLATQSYSIGHVSLINYLELLSGSTYGVTADGTPSLEGVPSSAQTLVNQLETAGISWRAYMESMPSAGYIGGDTACCGGQYYQHHNPFVYFPSVTSLPDFNTNMVPSTNLLSDLNSPTPPDFVWMKPNGTDDMHDGPVNPNGDVNPSVGDAWLGTFVSQVQSTAWYAQGGNIIIEWDEGSPSDASGVGTAGVGGGHIVTIDVSAALKASPQLDPKPVNAAGILHSIEGAYGLPYLADAAAAANGNIDALLGARSSIPTPSTTTTTTTTTTTAAPSKATVVAPPTTAPTKVAPSTPTTEPPGRGTVLAAPTPTTLASTAKPGEPAPPSATDSSQAVGATDNSGSDSARSSDPSVVSASSGALAFTGSGPGVQTLGILGGGLLLLGIFLMALVELPRRPLGQVALVETIRPCHESGETDQRTREPWRSDLWLVPPS